MDQLEITFLRHGRSRADDEGVMEGRYDSPLTEAGQAQARARGTEWMQRGVQFDQVICSTLARARTTAEIVAGILGSPLEADPAWMEMDNGLLSGLSFAEADQRFPKQDFFNPYDRKGKTGESDVDLHTRAALALQNVVRRGPGRYLVVAHGGILNAALRVIAGAPHPVNFHGVWFAFGDLGYARFTYNPAGHRWTMRAFCGGF